MSNKTALITGASKGLGKEFAYIHAANGDNLVLVARSKDQLLFLKQELESNYTVKVELIVKDLTASDSATDIYNELKMKNIQIDYLINNAGFGDFGFFVDTNWDRYAQMIDLNIKSLTHLCHLFLPDMIARNQGKIMNVSSTAAFQPGPMMTVYFASKAYVQNFSEALNNEVKDKGITVTALCPGPTDTHFMDDSKMKESKLLRHMKLASSKEVAFAGYKAMMNAKTVKIHGLFNNIMIFSLRLVPRKWVVSIFRKVGS